MSRYAKLMLIGIIALAAFLRFGALDRIPPGIWPDEAINGVEGWYAAESGNFRIFYPTNNGREGFWINLVGLSVKTFGANQFGLRFPAALTGTLTVLGLFFLARELFRRDDETSGEVLAAENSESQAPNSKQIQNLNDQGLKQFKNSDFKNWNLFEILNLRFGISRGDALALLAAFFLATSYWHLNFSRIAFRANMVPLLLVWSFWLLLYATNNLYDKQPLRQESNKNSCRGCKLLVVGLLGGALFGLGFHTYIAFRVAPLLLAVLIVLLIWQSKKPAPTPDNDSAVRVTRYALLVTLSGFIVSAFIVALPMGWYLATHREDINKRDGAKIGVFEQARPLKALGESIGRTALMFNIRGDCNRRHNQPCWPQLSPLIGIAFLAGMGIAIKYTWKYIRRIWYLVFRIWYKAESAGRKFQISNIQDTKYEIRDTAYVFLLAWFLIFLLPEVLTAEGIPHALRAIGILPPVMIFAALGFWRIYRFLADNADSRIRGMRIVIMIIVIISALADPFRYFFVWARHQDTASQFTGHYTAIAEYFSALPPDTPKFIIANEGDVRAYGTSVHVQTINFLLLDNPDVARHVMYINPEQISSYPFPAESVIVPLKKTDDVFEALRGRNFDFYTIDTQFYKAAILENHQ
ncbi:MAG: hypothetical protein Q8Q39_02065 [bacterium]|nr:hypothetical protein [bacterium]